MRPKNEHGTWILVFRGSYAWSEKSLICVEHEVVVQAFPVGSSRPAENRPRTENRRLCQGKSIPCSQDMSGKCRLRKIGVFVQTRLANTRFEILKQAVEFAVRFRFLNFFFDDLNFSNDFFQVALLPQRIGQLLAN